MNLYQVTFMARSGHTAICNWLSKQTRSMPNMDRGAIGPDGRIKAKDWQKHENAIIQNWPSGWNWNLARVTEPGVTLHNVVIVRSFENWIASALFQNGGGAPLQSAHYWRDFGLSLLFSDDSFIHIVFDCWFSSKEYRRKITQRLGLPFTDDGMTRVFERSSFDSLEVYRYRAHEMDVLNRWKSIEDKPIAAVFKDMHVDLRTVIAPFFNPDTTDEQIAEIRRDAKANRQDLLRQRGPGIAMTLPPQTSMSQEKAQWVYDLHVAERQLDRIRGDPKAAPDKVAALERRVEELRAKIASAT